MRSIEEMTSLVGMGFRLFSVGASYGEGVNERKECEWTQGKRGIKMFLPRHLLVVIQGKKKQSEMSNLSSSCPVPVEKLRVSP